VEARGGCAHVDAGEAAEGETACQDGSGCSEQAAEGEVAECLDRVGMVCACWRWEEWVGRTRLGAG